AAAERAFDKAAKQSPANGPGCAVGVSLDGKSVFEKGFGMAEMEYQIPITPKTIFESGSVAKQFTAAAIVALSLDGKLSLDDPVRKYVPEMPDYGSPLTIRHLLNHTSGLRDWGSVMQLTGVGRGDRVVSQSLAIDVIRRQKGLDFIPGAEYSYSNSNYNLLAEIVERVSKQKFPAFMQERFFKPLAMTNSSWRDDYQRIVPGRAQAYEGPLAGPWRLSMPFMNVYGNGGMLTTVGDWLKWNAMLESRSLGAKLVDEMETVGVLNDGRKSDYALGLIVDKTNGYRRVWHNGSTAGYQTILTRYPDLKLSIAVMCNLSSRNGPLEPDIFTEIMGPFPTTTRPEAFKVDPETLKKYVGIWKSERTRMANRMTVDNGVLKINGTPLVAQSDGSFVIGPQRFVFKMGSDGNPISAEANNNGDIRTFTFQKEWNPTAEELNALAGRWYSEEADAVFTIAVENGQAVLTQRTTGDRLTLRPQFKDNYFIERPGTVLWLVRDSTGKIATMHVGTSRLRDMQFVRMP
ncbi:MAG TPA: serine hydrolase domain-containing protein, partial [Pyrinomonadaceae bacterium]|nr:serine hydrolase domain-containing protein [Pyrinomonadaceae bacterium]